VSTPPSRWVRATTWAFFAALIMIGVALYDDYGISWDEMPTREFGVMYVTGEVPNLPALEALRIAKGPAFERFGPLFEIFLVKIEQTLIMSDSRAIFLMRHLVTFFTFVLGVFLFHRLCRRRFGDGIALLAAASLAASPQLFSHAFYNTKDIAFLTGFVGVVLALDSVLNNPTWRPWLAHALATSALLGLRVIGLFAVAMSSVALLTRRPTRQTFLALAASGALVLVLLPVVWPVVWIDPIGVVKGAILSASSNPYLGSNLFRGEMVLASKLPWDYLPTWIMITTPLVLSGLFFVGTWRAMLACVRAPRVSFFEQQRDVIVLGWFFVPVLGAIVRRPIMYDAWRHFFFVYPAFLYIAAIGMEWIAARAMGYFGEARQRTVRIGLVSALALGMAPAIAFMIRNHPLEHLYFNRLAGPDMASVKQRYDFDYWGLSYRQTLEYIVRTDTTKKINVRAANYPGIANWFILPEPDRRRIRLVSRDEVPDYFITNYRNHPEPYPYDEVFQVRVGNASAASVFRIKPQ
jgi:hypothetical protein